MFEEMIVTGAWWDFVDTIAGHSLGDILRAEPRRMKPLMRRWAKDADMWKRRASILCQLGFKRETDLDLLYDCIEPNLSHKDFFIRKAIGWALRQYAWTDPKEVRRYVKANKDRLSPLSVREAMKNTVGPAEAGHYEPDLRRARCARGRARDRSDPASRRGGAARPRSSPARPRLRRQTPARRRRCAAAARRADSCCARRCARRGLISRAPLMTSGDPVSAPLTMSVPAWGSPAVTSVS